MVEVKVNEVRMKEEATKHMAAPVTRDLAAISTENPKENEKC